MCCKIRKICKIKFVKFDLQSATQYSHFRRIFIIIAVFNEQLIFLDLLQNGDLHYFWSLFFLSNIFLNIRPNKKSLT